MARYVDSRFSLSFLYVTSPGSAIKAMLHTMSVREGAEYDKDESALKIPGFIAVSSHALFLGV